MFEFERRNISSTEKLATIRSSKKGKLVEQAQIDLAIKIKYEQLFAEAIVKFIAFSIGYCRIRAEKRKQKREPPPYTQDSPINEKFNQTSMAGFSPDSLSQSH